MSVLAYFWQDDNISVRWPVWLGVCPDFPAVNATSPIPPDPDRADLASMLAESWTRLHPDDDPVTAEDIDLRPKPDDWENPNQRAEQAAAAADLVVHPGGDG